MKKQILIAALTIVFTATSYGKIICNSSGNGNWSGTFSCTGSSGVTVYTIRSGDSITVNVSGTSLIDTLFISGILNFNSGRKIDMAAGGIIVVKSGGKITGGNGGSKFTFVGGTDIFGPFSVTGAVYATGSTSGAFITGPPLPVEWLDFKASLKNKNVELNWSTVSEKNNSHFEVENSINGLDWQNIATVKASNNPLQINNYTYSCPMAHTGINYYRIKQVDMNGDCSYSSLAYVRYDEIIKLSIYPNPASEFVNVQIEDIEQIASVLLMTITGQVLTAIIEPKTAIQIDTKSFPKGIYSIRITDLTGNVSLIKLVLE
ncbi:MAG: T9SS type A sorting domain-containing protein [Bacteroidota bacterium]